ncbi:hypothetical protein B9Z19DRAFT_1126819 [Tuber borchii]|uniref:Uncharacterized protein n=1 Tax=Tuber borchii TaxID=42251 RepID=A0A2T6ZSD0_TUBBO|nr:hypothetical protein B9Z19DRAFT_1126819 [Tuber borchii]
MSDHSSIEWETVTSRNGVSFRIGREKTQGEDVAPASGKSFSIEVNWPVGSGWVKTTDEVRTTAGITQYNLSTTPGGSIFQYFLQFNNTDTYDYEFYDETGDSYEVNTFTTRTHSVQYNSDKPTIVRITGS